MMWRARRGWAQLLVAVIGIVSCDGGASSRDSDGNKSEKEKKGKDDDDGKSKKKSKKKKGASGEGSGAAPATAAPQPTAAPAEATKESACADLAAARCARHESCDGGYWLRWHYLDAAACKAAETADCLDLATTADAATQPADIAACAKGVTEGGCGAAMVAACRFRGTRAPEAACAIGAQCQSGNCFKKGIADPCGVCGKELAEGAACKAFHPDRCAPGLSCHRDKCTAIPPTGGDCSKTGLCGGYATCSKAGVCVALPKEGEACDLNADPPRTCDYSYTCDGATRKCAPRKLAATGEPCGFGSEGTYCAVGYCDMPTRKCVPLPKEGEACNVGGGNLQCLDPFTCVGEKCQMEGKSICP